MIPRLRALIRDAVSPRKASPSECSATMGVPSSESGPPHGEASSTEAVSAERARVDQQSPSPSLEKPGGETAQDMVVDQSRGTPTSNCLEGAPCETLEADEKHSPVAHHQMNAPRTSFTADAERESSPDATAEWEERAFSHEDPSVLDDVHIKEPTHLTRFKLCVRMVSEDAGVEAQDCSNAQQLDSVTGLPASPTDEHSERTTTFASEVADSSGEGSEKDTTENLVIATCHGTDILTTEVASGCEDAFVVDMSGRHLQDVEGACEVAVAPTHEQQIANQTCTPGVQQPITVGNSGEGQQKLDYSQARTAAPTGEDSVDHVHETIESADAPNEHSEEQRAGEKACHDGANACVVGAARLCEEVCESNGDADQQHPIESAQQAVSTEEDSEEDAHVGNNAVQAADGESENGSDHACPEYMVTEASQSVADTEHADVFAKRPGQPGQQQRQLPTCVQDDARVSMDVVNDDLAHVAPASDEQKQIPICNVFEEQQRLDCLQTRTAVPMCDAEGEALHATTGSTNEFGERSDKQRADENASHRSADVCVVGAAELCAEVCAISMEGDQQHRIESGQQAASTEEDSEEDARVGSNVVQAVGGESPNGSDHVCPECMVANNSQSVADTEHADVFAKRDEQPGQQQRQPRNCVQDVLNDDLVHLAPASDEQKPNSTCDVSDEQQQLACASTHMAVRREQADTEPAHAATDHDKLDEQTSQEKAFEKAEEGADDQGENQSARQDHHEEQQQLQQLQPNCVEDHPSGFLGEASNNPEEANQGKPSTTNEVREEQQQPDCFQTRAAVNMCVDDGAALHATTESADESVERSDKQSADESAGHRSTDESVVGTARVCEEAVAIRSDTDQQRTVESAQHAVSMEDGEQDAHEANKRVGASWGESNPKSLSVHAGYAGSTVLLSRGDAVHPDVFAKQDDLKKEQQHPSFFDGTSVPMSGGNDEPSSELPSIEEPRPTASGDVPEQLQLQPCCAQPCPAVLMGEGGSEPLCAAIEPADPHEESVQQGARPENFAPSEPVKQSVANQVGGRCEQSVQQEACDERGEQEDWHSSTHQVTGVTGDESATRDGDDDEDQPLLNLVQESVQQGASDERGEHVDMHGSAHQVPGVMENKLQMRDADDEDQPLLNLVQERAAVPTRDTSGEPDRGSSTDCLAPTEARRGSEAVDEHTDKECTDNFSLEAAMRHQGSSASGEPADELPDLDCVQDLTLMRVDNEKWAHAANEGAISFGGRSETQATVPLPSTEAPSAVPDDFEEHQQQLNEPGESMAVQLTEVGTDAVRTTTEPANAPEAPSENLGTVEKSYDQGTDTAVPGAAMVCQEERAPPGEVECSQNLSPGQDEGEEHAHAANEAVAEFDEEYVDQRAISEHGVGKATDAVMHRVTALSGEASATRVEFEDQHEFDDVRQRTKVPTSDDDNETAHGAPTDPPDATAAGQEEGAVDEQASYQGTDACASASAPESREAFGNKTSSIPSEVAGTGALLSSSDAVHGDVVARVGGRTDHRQLNSIHNCAAALTEGDDHVPRTVSGAVDPSWQQSEQEAAGDGAARGKKRAAGLTALSANELTGVPAVDRDGEHAPPRLDDGQRSGFLTCAGHCEQESHSGSQPCTSADENPDVADAFTVQSVHGNVLGLQLDSVDDVVPNSEDGRRKKQKLSRDLVCFATMADESAPEAPKQNGALCVGSATQGMMGEQKHTDAFTRQAPFSFEYLSAVGGDHEDVHQLHFLQQSQVNRTNEDGCDATRAPMNFINAICAREGAAIDEQVNHLDVNELCPASVSERMCVDGEEIDREQEIVDAQVHVRTEESCTEHAEAAHPRIEESREAPAEQVTAEGHIEHKGTDALMFLGTAAPGAGVRMRNDRSDQHVFDAVHEGSALPIHEDNSEIAGVPTKAGDACGIQWGKEAIGHQAQQQCGNDSSFGTGSMCEDAAASLGNADSAENPAPMADEVQHAHAVGEHVQVSEAKASFASANHGVDDALVSLEPDVREDALRVQSVNGNAPGLQPDTVDDDVPNLENGRRKRQKLSCDRHCSATMEDEPVLDPPEQNSALCVGSATQGVIGKKNEQKDTDAFTRQAPFSFEYLSAVGVGHDDVHRLHFVQQRQVKRTNEDWCDAAHAPNEVNSATGAREIAAINEQVNHPDVDEWCPASVSERLCGDGEEIDGQQEIDDAQVHVRTEDSFTEETEAAHPRFEESREAPFEQITAEDTFEHRGTSALMLVGTAALGDQHVFDTVRNMSALPLSEHDSEPAGAPIKVADASGVQRYKEAIDHQAQQKSTDDSSFGAGLMCVDAVASLGGADRVKNPAPVAYDEQHAHAVGEHVQTSEEDEVTEGCGGEEQHAFDDAEHSSSSPGGVQDQIPPSVDGGREWQTLDSCQESKSPSMDEDPHHAAHAAVELVDSSGEDSDADSCDCSTSPKPAVDLTSMLTANRSAAEKAGVCQHSQDGERPLREDLWAPIASAGTDPFVVGQVQYTADLCVPGTSPTPKSWPVGKNQGEPNLNGCPMLQTVDASDGSDIEGIDAVNADADVDMVPSEAGPPRVRPDPEISRPLVADVRRKSLKWGRDVLRRGAGDEKQPPLKRLRRGTPEEHSARPLRELPTPARTEGSSDDDRDQEESPHDECSAQLLEAKQNLNASEENLRQAVGTRQAEEEQRDVLINELNEVAASIEVLREKRVAANHALKRQRSDVVARRRGEVAAKRHAERCVQARDGAASQVPLAKEAVAQAVEAARNYARSASESGKACHDALATCLGALVDIETHVAMVDSSGCAVDDSVVDADVARVSQTVEALAQTRERLQNLRKQFDELEAAAVALQSGKTQAGEAEVAADGPAEAQDEGAGLAGAQTERQDAEKAFAEAQDALEMARRAAAEAMQTLFQTGTAFAASFEKTKSRSVRMDQVKANQKKVKASFRQSYYTWQPVKRASDAWTKALATQRKVSQKAAAAAQAQAEAEKYLAAAEHDLVEARADEERCTQARVHSESDADAAKETCEALEAQDSALKRRRDELRAAIVKAKQEVRGKAKASNTRERGLARYPLRVAL